MKLVQRILLLCIFNALLVTGEEMFLLTYKGKLYRHNTTNNETKQLAQKDPYKAIACDYERKWLYCAYFNDHTMIRMDQDGGDMTTITEKDSDDLDIVCISVDQETGDVYYASTKRLVFLSYKQNYTKTFISTRLNGPDIVYVRVHGKGDNKRVYWSTIYSLYTSQKYNFQLTNLQLICPLFSILDNGIVCSNGFGKGFYLANLNGVMTESLPNVSIQSSKLTEIDCYPSEVTTLDGKLYLVCHEPNRILQLNLKTNTPTVVIRPPTSDVWESILPLPSQKVILPDQNVELPDLNVDQNVELPDQNVELLDQNGALSRQPLKSLSVSTIVMVVMAVVIGIVLIAILVVTILKYKKKRDRMPKRSNNDQRKEPIYSTSLDNGQQDRHVYATLSAIEFLELKTLSSPDNRPEECHLYDTIPFREHKLSTPKYDETL